MIPRVETPLSAAMVRDGGSLALHFEAQGNSYWLFFPILKDGTPRRLGYGSPVVRNRTLGTEAPTTWEDAASTIKECMEDLSEERHVRWAKIMVKVARSGGKLPDEISPAFE